MSSNIVTSTSVASIFLTRPFLFLSIKPTVVSAITIFLQDFLTVSGGERQTLNCRPALLPSLPEITASCNADTIALIKTYFGGIPTVSSASSASAKLAVPTPLALACHFFGFAWNDWFAALGGSEFELVLKPRCVYVVKKSDGCIGVVWANMNMSVDIIHPSVTAPLHPASPSLSSPLDSPDSESDSRPSSRSSNYSTFSFSSHSSSSSRSSTGHSDAPPRPKSSHNASFPGSFTRTTTTRPTFAPLTNTFDTTQHKLPTTPIAPSKATLTRYLYQGGMSTVLTGGVMLGNSAQAPRKPQTTLAPAPAQSLVPHCIRASIKVHDHAGPSGSWRRTTRVMA